MEIDYITDKIKRGCKQWEINILFMSQVMQMTAVKLGIIQKYGTFSHIMPGAVIGSGCSIGQNVNVGGKAVIGNRVKIQNNVSIYDDVILEDDVFCGPSCVFTNVFNPRAFVERKHEYRKTIVKKGASIGANATISMRINSWKILFYRCRQCCNSGCS